jgi:hypothetical protein
MPPGVGTNDLSIHANVEGLPVVGLEQYEITLRKKGTRHHREQKKQAELTHDLGRVQFYPLASYEKPGVVERGIIGMPVAMRCGPEKWIGGGEEDRSTIIFTGLRHVPEPSEAKVPAEEGCVKAGPTKDKDI